MFACHHQDDGSGRRWRLANDEELSQSLSQRGSPSNLQIDSQLPHIRSSDWATLISLRKVFFFYVFLCEWFRFSFVWWKIKKLKNIEGTDFSFLLLRGVWAGGNWNWLTEIRRTNKENCCWTMEEFGEICWEFELNYFRLGAEKFPSKLLFYKGPLIN